MSTLNLTGPGAAYYRVSTEHQDAERQRQTTLEWATRHGVSIHPDRVFADIGWSRGDASRRPAFNRMLDLAESGHIKWIVVDRQDRFGTAHFYQFAAYMNDLITAGCRLFTVDDKELTSNSLADMMMALLAGKQSEQELHEKAIRNLEGKRQLAKRGRWLGGTIPFALDVVAFKLIDGGLIEQWRVQARRRDLKIKISSDGTRRSFEGGNNFPASEQDEVLQLRPTTEADQIDVLKHVFAKYLSESTSPGTIARQLNAQHIPPPGYSTTWRASHISHVLENPAYIGLPAWNRNTSGDYFKFMGGRRVEKRPGEKPTKHKREDWVMPAEPLFDPIIDPDLFAKVQAKLAGRVQQPRATRNAGYILSGLVRCGNCGGAMTGAKMPTKGLPASDWPLTYLCGSYNKHHGPRETCPCKAYRITQQALVQRLQLYLDENGLELIVDDNGAFSPPTNVGESAIEKAARRMMPALLRMYQRVRPNTDFPVEALADGAVAQLLTPADAIENDELERAYRRLFDADHGRSRAALDQRETEHSRLTLSWQDLPTQRSKEKAAARLRELEREIAELERAVRNWADELQAAVEEYREIAEKWDHAREAIENQSSARVVAAAIKAVIGRITVTFRPTGRSWPVGEVASITFEPAQGFSEGASTTRSA